MATRDSVLTPATTQSAGTGHAHFGRLLLAEWTKIRSVRSTYWSLIALVVAFLFFSWLFPYLNVATWKNATPADKARLLEDPIGQTLAPGIYFGQLAVAVLGVMVTAGEYSTGMIRSTLLASPHRMRMLAAKSIVFTLLILVIGEAVAFVGFFIGRLTLKNLLTIDLNSGDIRQVFGIGLYLGMLGLFSLVIGALVRHVAGAITGIVSLLLVISGVIQLIPGKTGKYLYTYEPTNAGFAIVGKHLPDNFLISSWEGYGVFALWTAALWALAAYLLVSRDA